MSVTVRDRENFIESEIIEHEILHLKCGLRFVLGPLLEWFFWIRSCFPMCIATQTLPLRRCKITTMQNFMKIGKLVWLCIANTQTDRQTHTHMDSFIDIEYHCFIFIIIIIIYYLTLIRMVSVMWLVLVQVKVR